MKFIYNRIKRLIVLISNVLIVFIVFSRVIFIFFLFFNMLCFLMYLGYFVTVWYISVETFSEYHCIELIEIWRWKPLEFNHFYSGVYHGEDVQAGLPLYYRQFESLNKFFNEPYM